MTSASSNHTATWRFYENDNCQRNDRKNTGWGQRCNPPDHTWVRGMPPRLPARRLLNTRRKSPKTTLLQINSLQRDSFLAYHPPAAPNEDGSKDPGRMRVAWCPPADTLSPKSQVHFQANLFWFIVHINNKSYVITEIKHHLTLQWFAVLG